jgi:hypothetical protein
MWGESIAMPVARYPAATRRYAVPQKYEFVAMSRLFVIPVKREPTARVR